MSQSAGFVWKGISFSWSEHRAAFIGATHLRINMVSLFVRQSDRVDTWESWCEFNSWHTAPCVMGTRDDALQGSVLEICSFFESMAADAQVLAARDSNPFHDHLDHCKQCEGKPFNLCATGAQLLSQAATRQP